MLANGMCLDYYHHRFGIGKQPEEYEQFRDEWLQERGWTIEELRTRAKEVEKIPTSELEELAKELKELNGSK